MTEEPAPSLESMSEPEARDFLIHLFSEMSPHEEYRIRHEAYVMDMPQSGERIRGRDNMRAFQEAFPDPPSIDLRRVTVREGLWVVEAVSRYADQTYYVVVMLELQEGKIVRDTRFYAEQSEPPAWRAQWVEKLKY